jgi:thioredoxin 1
MEGALQDSTMRTERAVDLDENEMERFVRNFDLVIVDCWVGWCKHSKKMDPLFDSLAKEMAGKAVFGRLDAQENFHVPVKYRVTATPTFLIFKKGSLVERLVGEISKTELDQSIRRYVDERPVP